jgi:hypothetical protein
MSSLQVRLSDLITALGNDRKNIWDNIGSGTLDTVATDLIAAINEVNAAVTSATIPDASATVKGKVELATDAEAITGTDTVRAVTPANVAAVFTDRIDTNSSLGTSNTKVPSQNAVKAYADALIGANDAMVYKGVIDASANPNYPAGNKGDTYRISVAGKIGGASGPNVEVGDIIIGLTDGSSAGNHATVGSSWNIVQSNIDGAVTGPASSTTADFATFSGTTGKVIQDSGVTLDTDAALAANSDAKIPSQKAVKAYAQPLDSDLTAIAALATTSYGRALLALADQAALTAALALSSESLPGIIELATQTETDTGTDDARAVTPLKLRSNMGDPDTNLASLYATAKT